MRRPALVDDVCSGEMQDRVRAVDHRLPVAGLLRCPGTQLDFPRAAAAARARAEPRGRCFAAGEDHDVVAALGQRTHEALADETCASGDDDAHDTPTMPQPGASSQPFGGSRVTRDKLGDMRRYLAV